VLQEHKIPLVSSLLPSTLFAKRSLFSPTKSTIPPFLRRIVCPVALTLEVYSNSQITHTLFGLVLS
jgi:hypothetical protein